MEERNRRKSGKWNIVGAQSGLRTYATTDERQGQANDREESAKNIYVNRVTKKLRQCDTQAEDEKA